MSQIKRVYQLMEDLDSLTTEEFESLIIDLLKKNRQFRRIDSYVNQHNGDHGVDIVGEEFNSETNTTTKWLIQAKKADLTSSDSLRFLKNYVSNNKEFEKAKILFVTSGTITTDAREFLLKNKIQVWTAYDLYSLISPDIEEKYFSYTPLGKEESAKQSLKKNDALANALKSLPPGIEHWSPYQKLISDIFEFLFCPPLELPRYELFDADEKNRRDMIFENSTENGFWKSLRETYSADYIVVDAKNHDKDIDKKPVIEIAHYLKPYGCGMFGIIVTRKGMKDSAYHAIREQWIGNNKMIVVIDDSDIADMLRISNERGKPEELIRKKIADFRMKL